MSTPLARSQVTAHWTTGASLPHVRRRGGALLPVLDESVDVPALLEAPSGRGA